MTIFNARTQQNHLYILWNICWYITIFNISRNKPESILSLVKPQKCLFCLDNWLLRVQKMMCLFFWQCASECCVLKICQDSPLQVWSGTIITWSNIAVPKALQGFRHCLNESFYLQRYPISCPHGRALGSLFCENFPANWSCYNDTGDCTVCSSVSSAEWFFYLTWISHSQSLLCQTVLNVHLFCQ